MKKHREDNSLCEACGTAKRLQVHHKKPVHVAPLEADKPNNLLTLCKRCHFSVGHACNWKKWVPSVENIAGLIRGDIRADKG